MIEEEERKGIGEVIDRLVSVPVYTGSALARKPVLLELYDAARQRFTHPLSFLAAELIIKSVKKGEAVIITTGFVVPPWLRPENDGPVGAAGLARALNLGLEAVPVIVAEKVVIEMMPQVIRAAGLMPASLSEAKGLLRRVALEPFTTREKEARDQARELLQRVNPSLIIAIEKSSANEKGAYHSGVGFNLTPLAAKVDCLIEEARLQGIPTLGIGDGGNEIGMGCIKETVKRVVPTGAKCGCPCGAGTHAATETDLLVVAAVSNWGASAIEANLALALETSELLHDSELEEEMLKAAGRAGFIDPARGLGAPSADAIDKNVHMAVIEILRFIVTSRLKDDFFIKKYKEYASQRRAKLQARIFALDNESSS